MGVREASVSSKPVLFQGCTESKRLMISKSGGIVLAGHWSEFQFNVNPHISFIVVQRQNLEAHQEEVDFYQNFTLTSDIVFDPVLKSVIPVTVREHFW